MGAPAYGGRAYCCGDAAEKDKQERTAANPIPIPIPIPNPNPSPNPKQAEASPPRWGPPDRKGARERIVVHETFWPSPATRSFEGGRGLEGGWQEGEVKQI